MDKNTIFVWSKANYLIRETYFQQLTEENRLTIDDYQESYGKWKYIVGSPQGFLWQILNSPWEWLYKSIKAKWQSIFADSWSESQRQDILADCDHQRS